MQTPWTEQEDTILLQMKSRNATDKEIGEQLARSEESVRSRRRRLSRNLNKEAPRVRSSRSIDHPPVYLKAAIFDIETTDFSASGWDGHLICCSILPLDQDEPYTLPIRFEDHRDDRIVLKEVIAELEKYDILCGHNIAAFDIGFLYSRLAYHAMPMPNKRFFYYDTYSAARRCAIKAERKSLAFLCDYFRIPFIKTSIYPASWSKIESPIKEEFDDAIEDIVYHCTEDVKANRKLFDVLWRIDGSLVNIPRIRKW